MDSQIALNQILALMGNLNPKDLAKLQKQISPKLLEIVVIVLKKEEFLI